MLAAIRNSRWLLPFITLFICMLIVVQLFYPRFVWITLPYSCFFGVVNCLNYIPPSSLQFVKDLPEYINRISWLILPGICLFGAAHCVYYGRILFFKLQCSLLELMFIATLFGLVDGLLLSTPGALKMGLYLSTVVAAWVLSAAVTGRTRAELFDSSSQKARLLHLVAALVGRVSLAMMLLGVAILYIPDMALFETKEFQAAKWPLVVVGALGFVIDLRLNFQCRKRARKLLDSESAKRSLDVQRG